MTSEKQMQLIDAIQNDRPGYSVRIINGGFTDAVEIRNIKARKEGRKYILPGWIFIGYADDLMRRYGIEI